MIHPAKCHCPDCYGVWVHEKFEIIHHHGDIRIQNDHTLAPREVATLRILLDQAEESAKCWRKSQCPFTSLRSADTQRSEQQ